MSNLDTEKEYDNMTDWLKFNFPQLMKNVYTCLPAIISSYDSSTKRAVIQIAIQQLKTDDTESSYPLIANVPVIFPASSKYIVQFPLEAKDPVIAIFSQRGLSKFKQVYEEALPDVYSFFSMHDACVIPGFGTLQNTVAEEDALVAQTVDASTYISIKTGEIKVVATEIVLDGNVQTTGNLEAATLSINGEDLPTNHRHQDVQPGAGTTSTPIS